MANPFEGQLDDSTYNALVSNGMLTNSDAVQAPIMPPAEAPIAPEASVQNIPESLRPNSAPIEPNIVQQTVESAMPQIAPTPAMPPASTAPVDSANSTIISSGNGPMPVQPELPVESATSSIISPEEQKIEAASKMAADAELASQRGVQKAQAEQAIKIQKEADDQQKLVQSEVAEADKAGAMTFQNIMSNGSMGQKFLAAMSLLAGGIGGALSGKGGNAAWDVFQKAYEQQLEEKKLNAAQKEAAKKALFEEAKFKLEQEKAKTDSLEKQQRLNIEIEKLNLDRDKHAMEMQSKAELQAAKSFLSGSQAAVSTATPEIALDNKRFDAALSAYEANGKPEEVTKMRERIVVLPTGKKVLASADGSRVRKFEDEKRIPGEESIRLINDIKTFYETGSKLSPEDRARMGTRLTVLMGKLRVPMLGPGTMQEAEYERLKEAIGNPSSFFDAYKNSSAKLDVLQQMLKSDIRSSAKNIGIDWPSSKEERIIDAIVTKYGANSKEAADAIKRLKNRGQ